MMLTKEQFKYCPYYCEENIWHLCQEKVFAGKACLVMFISNLNKRCATWYQRASGDPQVPVVWDYHLVLLVREESVKEESVKEESVKEEKWLVYDFDSYLPFGVDLDVYLQCSFMPDLEDSVMMRQSLSEFSPCFKLICAKDYKKKFSSGRRHMLKDDGSWHAPPPPWPLITASEGLSLEQLTDMSHGEVCTLNTLKSMLVD